MAFLLPLVEAGAYLSSLLVEAGAPTLVAGAISGVAVKKTTQIANEAAASGILKIEEALLGADGAKQANKDISSLVSGVFKLATNPISLIGDPRQTAGGLITGPVVINRSYSSDQSPISSDQSIDQTESTNSDCKCKDTELSEAAVLGLVDNGIKIEDINEPAVVIPSGIASSAAQLLLTHSSELANAGVQDHLSDILPALDIESTKDHTEILDSLIDGDPAKYTLVQKLSNFYADSQLSQSEEFKKIYSVYNGKGFGSSNIIMTEDADNYLFYSYDETKKLVVLKQNKKALTLPAVYGVFGGPMSPNNRLPGVRIPGKVYPVDYTFDEILNYEDVPDCIFECHDADYSENYFDWVSDMKLVSRLVQTRDKWPRDKVSLLNSIVIYFATLGSSLATIKGSIVGNPAKEVIVDDVKDDLFPALVPEALELPSEDYANARHEFYKEFANTALKNQATLKIFSSGTKKMFDSINIELL